MSAGVETGWLIEMSGAPLWWTGTCWSADSNHAIRFARRVDGENAARAWKLTGYWVGDHMWIPGGAAGV